MHIEDTKPAAPAPAVEARRRKRAEGYTIIEVIVAMYVLAVVMTSLFGAVRQGMNMVETSRDYTRVAQLIQSEMEKLRTMEFSTIDSLSPVADITSSTASPVQFNNRYTVFRYNLGDHPESARGMVRIHILVAWYSEGSFWNYRLATTDFTEDGLNDFYYRNI